PYSTLFRSMITNNNLTFSISCIIVIFLLINSCRHSENKSIVNKITIDDIDKLDVNDTLFMSNIFSNPRYISLESTEEALCGFIRGIRLSKSYIALNCDNGIFIFDKSGHFISKINNIGKGAFEYLLALNIQFKNDSIIVVLDY